MSRQKVQTVARLHLSAGVDPVIEHIGLHEPEQIFMPRIELAAGFIAARDQYSKSALAPELDACIGWVRNEVYPLAPQAVLDVFVPLMRRRWTGELPPLTLAELMAAVQKNKLPKSVMEKLRESPAFAAYL